MEKIFKSIYETLLKGQDVMLASIISSSGSTPRGQGAKMLVFEDGSTEGTIGGGRVEYLCALRAAEALRKKRSFVAAYDLSNKDIADVGMICGGNVEVCFKYFSSKDLALIQYINDLIKKQETSWLITRAEGSAVDIGIYDRINGVMFIDSVTDTDMQKWTECKHAFEHGGSTLFIEPLVKKGHVYIFGAGHVSRELAPLLSHLDFKVSVFEQREELIKTFPTGIDIIQGEFKEIGRYIDLTEYDYAVVMTSGHSADFEVLEQVLRKNLSYVGVIGSRNKIAITRKRLIECGIDENKIDSLHTPIGLAIKASTPAEIAVSVAGELILHRAEH